MENPILILREEITCLIILGCLFLYTFLFMKRIVLKKFRILCITAILHVIFDILTVISVNNADTPPIVNLILHLVFIHTALYFCICWLSYILSWTLSKKKQLTIEKFCKDVFVLYILISPFLGIEIVHGNGTNYSMGINIIISYSLAYICILSGVVILIANRKIISRELFLSMLPITLIYIISVTIQVFIPELLFTGASLTLASIGLFFAVENPAYYFMKKAYTDANTKIKNRACFEDDFELYAHLIEKSQQSAPKTGIIVCDLNGLKYCNDTFGHSTGDKMISVTAEIMHQHMQHAHELYRIGGDEFAAIYLNDNCSYISDDIKKVRQICKEESKSYTFPLSIAMGYAICTAPESLQDAYNRADANMYEDKLRMKQTDPDLIRL